MGILIHHERSLGAVTALGTWSTNTVRLHGLLMQIVVKHTTSTTEYDFALINDQNEVILNRTDIVGTINEEVGTPIKGVYTMRLQNSTRDEAFDIALIIQER